MSRTYRRTPDNLFLPWLFGTPWRKHKKPYWKPSKWYKKLRIAEHRAKAKECLRKGKEFPIDKKVDVWNWD